MNNAFFFQTQQISDSSSIFNTFKEQNIFFSYFLVDQNYYLFLYAQESIQLDTIYESVEVIEELDSKQRKIRSLRGFFLYALEIIEKGKNYEILSTNLQPFFWDLRSNSKNVIRQNKKAVLLEFLFGSQKISSTTDADIEKKFKALKNNLNSLQERVIHLENQNLVMEGKLNMLSADDEGGLK